jgi:prophage regulatory protein
MKAIDTEGLRSKKGIKWSKPHLWRKEKAGEFPKRIRLGTNSIVWDEEEIDAWLDSRKAQRGEAVS